MFIPTPLTLCSWICTVRGWLVLCSFFLACEYFAFAYVLRKVVFPVLQSLFQNFLVYQFFHTPLGTWIADMFYFCLGYTAIGLAGLIGALFEIQLLLWPYAIYLAVTWALNAKKAYDVLESVLAEEADLNKACNVAASLFGGNCNSMFSKLKEYSYAGTAAVLLLQATTLICCLVLIRRVYKESGALLFTCCGKSCGGHRKSDDNDLESGWAAQRRRRGRTRRGGPRQGLLAMEQEQEQDDKAGLGRMEADGTTRMAGLPPAIFELPRIRSRAEMGEDGEEATTFELGRSTYPPSPFDDLSPGRQRWSGSNASRPAYSLPKRPSRRRWVEPSRVPLPDSDSDSEELLRGERSVARAGRWSDRWKTGEDEQGEDVGVWSSDTERPS